MPQVWAINWPMPQYRKPQYPTLMSVKKEAWFYGKFCKLGEWLFSLVEFRLNWLTFTREQDSYSFTFWEWKVCLKHGPGADVATIHLSIQIWLVLYISLVTYLHAEIKWKEDKNFHLFASLSHWSTLQPSLLISAYSFETQMLKSFFEKVINITIIKSRQSLFITNYWSGFILSNWSYKRKTLLDMVCQKITPKPEHGKVVLIAC